MKSGKILLRLFLLLFLFGGAAAVAVWYVVFAPAITVSEPYLLTVGREDNLQTVTDKLAEDCGLKNPQAFLLLAEKMNVGKLLRAGRFEIIPEMSNRDIAVMLRKGGVLTVDVVIRGTQDVRNIPAFLAEKLEPEEADFRELLNNNEYLSQFGFDSKTVAAMFIPNTYNMYWFTNAEEVLERFYSEYQSYWTEERKARAAALNLTPLQVSVLASIVDKETSQTGEMSRIAGVYLNRLQKGWKLQADPTVKYAMDSMSLTRILIVHTKIEHPYNTYFIDGLPPAPICIPSLQSLNAVLNAEKHGYMFFCAKPDFSGYHNFAKTLREHEINAANYHRFLNRLERERKRK